MRRFDALTVPLDGANLVEASAGTGKTFAITTLVVRLLLERKLTIDQILVMTFTEAATIELRGRVRARLRQALAAFERGEAEGELGALVSASTEPLVDQKRLALALQHVDEAPIHTIHGFCHRVLTDSAFDSGVQFDAELQTDDTPLRDEVLLDFWTAELSGASRAVVRQLRRARMVPSQTRGLADAVLRAPYMPVLPPVLEEPQQPRRAELEAAFAQMCSHWDRSVVAAALSSSSLNRTVYRQASIPGWLDTMDEFVAASLDEVPKADDWLVKMSASKLMTSTKKSSVGQHPQHPFFDAVDALVNQVERFDAWGAAHAVWCKRRLVDYVRVQMPRRKEQLGVMSFDDLLQRLDDALAGVHGARLAATVRARYPIALVDEFQDTDPVQWAIVKRIWSDAAIFFIGDPKQAIYAFRGADVFAYMDAAAAVDEAHRFTMDINWRSAPRLVAAVGSLFGRVAYPFVMEAIRFPPVRARDGARDDVASPLEVLFVPRESGRRTLAADATTRLAGAVAADIADLLRSDQRIDGRPVEAGDIAILTRTNAQAFDAQRALRALSVRSVVLGDQSVFEETQAQDVALVLTAVAEPTSSGALRAALTTELLGVTASRLAAMDANREDNGAGSWTWWIERFRQLNELWVQRGFVQMFRALLSVAGVEQRLLALEDGERRVTNVRHLMELLHTASSTLHLGAAGLLQWLAVQRSPENARARPEAAQMRLESDEHAVKITTIHRSKGLEYPIVYCPQLWDGRLLFPHEKRDLLFHDPQDANVAKLDIAPLEGGVSTRRAEWEKLAEHVRLLYVALTRAKVRCTVVWGAFRGAFDTSALGYLLHPSPMSSEPPTVDDVRAHLAGLTDEGMLADIDELARTSDGAVSMRLLDLNRTAAPLQRPAHEQPQLVAREVTHSIEHWWRTASFSELASSRASFDSRDRDDPAVTPTPLPEHEPAEPRRAITLADFPRGARAGNFFHAVLENLDFEQDDRRELIRHQLAAHGFDQDRYEDLVETALTEVLDTALPVRRGPRRFTLRHLPRSRRLDELEFIVPVAGAAKRRVVPRGTQLELFFSGDDAPADGGVVALGRFTANKLAAVFEDHPSEHLAPDYAQRVARLGFLPLEGYLKGYIDLIYVHDERWYLVDYKTNHLGDHISDYEQARLPQAMAHGHYYLQYHLYAVALHRYLGRRLKGYDYERHFGGVQYLFLKGMTPDTGSSCGVFHERPPLARIEALSDLLERPPRARGER